MLYWCTLLFSDSFNSEFHNKKRIKKIEARIKFVARAEKITSVVARTERSERLQSTRITFFSVSAQILFRLEFSFAFAWGKWVFFPPKGKP